MKRGVGLKRGGKGPTPSVGRVTIESSAPSIRSSSSGVIGGTNGSNSGTATTPVLPYAAPVVSSVRVSVPVGGGGVQQHLSTRPVYTTTTTPVNTSSSQRNIGTRGGGGDRDRNIPALISSDRSTKHKPATRVAAIQTAPITPSTTTATSNKANSSTNTSTSSSQSNGVLTTEPTRLADQSSLASNHREVAPISTTAKRVLHTSQTESVKNNELAAKSDSVLFSPTFQCYVSLPLYGSLLLELQSMKHQNPKKKQKTTRFKYLNLNLFFLFYL